MKPLREDKSYSRKDETLLNYKVTICLLYESCFDIEKDYFRNGFPPEIYETIMCIQGAYFLSHKIRKNTQVFLGFLANNLVIHYVGTKLRYLGPDERSIGMLLMKALEKREVLVGNRRIQSSPGIYIQKKKIQDLILELGQKDQIFMADKNSIVELDNIQGQHLILLIPNTKKWDFFSKNFLSKLNIFKFGTNDLPEKMRDFLTILKFYSIFDNLL